MSTLYYEDVEVGRRYSIAGRSVNEMDLALFAMVSGDTHPVHVNALYAASTEFGQRIAHGPFGIALAIGLFGRIADFADTAIAMTDIRDWSFRAPIYIGDTLNLEMTIVAKRLTRSNRGIIDRHMQLLKQDGTVAQEGTSGLLIARRP
ncbi:MaoC/PaaZ C-terminal domain-containing protein [Paraburkholderia sp. IW21]|uniref:MaoC/PaaZ C-terminal domain-containing protein n=1 Tax=Paraburkholderia sp. IW21 TaxID=3242488 RepID=UPI003522624E